MHLNSVCIKNCMQCGLGLVITRFKYYRHSDLTLSLLDCQSPSLSLIRSQETLRMYPPLGLGQIRISQNDVTLGRRLRIPKGTLIWVPHHGIMNTELNWENPTQFSPGKPRFKLKRWQ